MKNMYNDLKHSDLGKKVLKMSAILIMIMVWILIDKGNVYGQSRALKGQISKEKLSGQVDQSMFKAGGGDDDGIIDEGSGSEGGNSFDAYPNPFERELVFDFEFTVKQEEGIPVEILDVQGRLVLQALLPSGSSQYKIDLGDLKTGMYFARVAIGNDLQVKRVIKK